MTWSIHNWRGHSTEVKNKLFFLWICELDSSFQLWDDPRVSGQTTKSTSMGPLHPGRFRGSSCPGLWVPCSYCSSPPSHYRRVWFMVLVRTLAYSLQPHQAVVPLANRKVQCLGLGLALSLYGLFLVINLERRQSDCRLFKSWMGSRRRWRRWAVGNTKRSKHQAGAPSRSLCFHRIKKGERNFSSCIFLSPYRRRFDRAQAKRVVISLFSFLKMPWCLWCGLSNEA